MPVSRMRMRQWLEQKIDSNTVSGLMWLDQERSTFSIPWKHAARHGWELDKDACLFKQWAIHTGKYVEGQTCDPKTWKANFRCAMNSLPDVEEVKGKSINKGHQAVRVYRMLPSSPKPRDKRSKARQTKQSRRPFVKSEADSDDSDAQSPRNVEESSSTSTQENRVDSTVLTDHEAERELPFVPFSEVPDWSLSVEVGANNCSDSYHRFEVSPAHSYDYDTDIIEICRQLEEDSDRLDRLDIGGFLNSDACTSPESTWSDSSSGDDLDDMPKYLTLDSTFMAPLQDLFASQNYQYYPKL